MAVKVPLGIRNNNPGNLVRSPAAKWQGVSEHQTESRFWSFDDPIYGVRAIARQLIAYQDKYGCKTVMDSISRYAPPGDNNPTLSYAVNVAKNISAFNKDPDYSIADPVDWHKYGCLRPAVEAIITQENGGPWQNWYTDAQLTKACVLAGVEPKKKSILKSGQVIGSAIAGAATAAQPVVQQIQDGLFPLVGMHDGLRNVFVVTALAGVGIAAISKINERKKGIS